MVQPQDPHAHHCMRKAAQMWVQVEAQGIRNLKQATAQPGDLLPMSSWVWRRGCSCLNQEDGSCPAYSPGGMRYHRKARQKRGSARNTHGPEMRSEVSSSQGRADSQTVHGTKPDSYLHQLLTQSPHFILVATWASHVCP